MDGWDFKAYVLGLLFYRFISENLADYINQGEHEAGDLDFGYALLPDALAEQERDGIVNEKGFFIAPSELFENVLERAPRDENLNVTMYASSAGKSGGEFFTPREVREILARITVIGKKRVNGVYETSMPRRIQPRVNLVLAA